MAAIDMTVDVGGKTYRGWYAVEKGMVTAHLSEGRGSSKATQVGSDRPEDVAKDLLHELVAEYLQR